MILFRCSSLGKIMTEPRSKSEVISETCKGHLIEVFVKEHYGREKDIQNRYTTKGLCVEDDSIKLYSEYKQEGFEKNEERFKNRFIIGTPDIVLSDKIIDIKSSWDIFTFLKNKNSLNKDYYWQLQGYMALTDRKLATIAYCLIDTPDALVFDEKRRLQFKMGVIDDANPDFQEACSKIDLLSYYSDIPLQERVIEVPVERNDSDIEKIYQRVKDCRVYIDQNLKPQLV